jgi:F-type H+-transporting ATPase subunit alpha
VATLETEVDKFKLEFQGEGGSRVGPGHEEFEATEIEDVNQEKIVKSRR